MDAAAEPAVPLQPSPGPTDCRYGCGGAVVGPLSGIPNIAVSRVPRLWRVQRRTLPREGTEPPPLLPRADGALKLGRATEPRGIAATRGCDTRGCDARGALNCGAMRGAD